MRFIILTFMVLAIYLVVSGCTTNITPEPFNNNKIDARILGTAKDMPRILCINGIVYYYWDRGITPAIDKKDFRYIPCKK